MEQVKGLEQYTQARDISFQKMIGMGGVEFTEYRMEDGVRLSISHFALPLAIKDTKIMESLGEQIDELTYKFREEADKMSKKMSDCQKKITAENPEGVMKEINKLEKEFKVIEKKYLHAIREKKLDIAVLVFKRTENSKREEIEEWIDVKTLDRIYEIAQGISYPPKQPQAELEMM